LGKYRQEFAQAYIFFKNPFSLEKHHAMSIKTKIQEILKKHNVKLSVMEDEEEKKVEMVAQGTLPDGTIVATPADAFDVDAELFVIDADGNPSPAPDGTHTVTSGDVTYSLTTEGGKITESVIAGAGEEELTEEVVEELAALNATLRAELEGVRTELSAVKAELDTTKEKLVKLSKQPAATSVKKTALKAEPKAPASPTDSKDPVEKIASRIRFNSN
jgi:hypothetical protein